MNPRVERTVWAHSEPTTPPVCPCHDWPMLERTGRLGWLCLWCGTTIEADGRSGRWRPEMPSDLLEWPSKRPRGEGTPGAMAQTCKEVEA
jgi:hypothetical protein